MIDDGMKTNQRPGYKFGTEADHFTPTVPWKLGVLGGFLLTNSPKSLPT